jgi:ABC-type multidrug transport system, ATPase and permease components
MGTHQELLKKRGLYWRLYQLQYKEQLLADGQAGGAGVEAAGAPAGEDDMVDGAVEPSA